MGRYIKSNDNRLNAFTGVGKVSCEKVEYRKQVSLEVRRYPVIKLSSDYQFAAMGTVSCDRITY